jgi:coenzyme F420-reducing hydrogenase alpha subunit
MAVRTESIQVDVHHVTRVEGHGNIVVDVRDGLLERCALEVVEAPRFFEAMLRGRPYAQAARLTSRICGICAVGHATTSLRATEKALGVELTEQTRLLRQLNFMGEILDSHVLHVYMLVAPDLVGAGSVFPLVATSPDVVMRALRMKRLAGDLCAAVSGRHTHPIAMAVGGFTHFPPEGCLADLARRLEEARADADATVALLQALHLPDFERETEYIALRGSDGYTFIDGEITSGDGGVWPVEDYQAVTNEFQVSHSTAKHTRHRRGSYMVGALARIHINHDHLHPRALAAAAALGLSPTCTNPFMNTVAQVVEIVHCVDEALAVIQALLERGVTPEPLAEPARLSGEGVGACEVPRGTLYHHYTIQNGVITGANCIIPTGQNLANIEADMRALVPRLLGKPQDEIRLALEMLVRAYDPCISCSTH